MTVILSTHLDDAVFSCHSMLAGATVVTICAGVPPEDTPPTAFDERAGFRSGAEAMRSRRAEDLEAAGLAGFTARHLECLEAGYGGGDIAAAVAEALRDVDGPVYGPCGLRHPDHIAVAGAFREQARTLDAWLYEDLPYAYVWPERLDQPTAVKPSRPDKEAAVRAYRSQITEDTHMAEILAPERYHRL